MSEKPVPAETAPAPASDAPTNSPAASKPAPIAPVTLIAVSFKEAVLDSPTFRASMNHVNEQFENLDAWIDSFTDAINRLSHEMDALQDVANFLISRFIPDFVTQGIIDHDYTMLALRRFAEATRHYWADTIKKVKTQNNKTLGPLATFRRNELRSYKEARHNFEATQGKYDNALAKYMANSKNKEASALREDAFQISESRRAYIKACFDLCVIICAVERQVNIVLVETLVEPWIIRSKSLVAGNPTYYQIGVDMYRIKSWSRAITAALKPIEAEMLRLRHEMEESAIARQEPSRDLNDYMAKNSNIENFHPDMAQNPQAARQPNEKHGWLFFKTYGKAGRPSWVRRWSFVKDGVFGWLVVAPSKTYVQEGDKLSVLLCSVTPDHAEERRFCFEIRTKDSVFIVQAESLAELKSWLQAFDRSKRQVLETGTSSAFELVHPIIPQFAAAAVVDEPQQIPVSAGSGRAIVGSALGSPTSSRRSTDLSRPPAPRTDYLASAVASKLQALMTAGKSMILASLVEHSQGDQFTSLGLTEAPLTPITLINTPMPTSMTKEALLSNGVVQITEVPSAVTANYWGSVNWAAYQPETVVRSNEKDNSVPASHTAAKGLPTLLHDYPEFYPLELRAQDIQMRAIFQGLADNDPNDRVVMVFRALFRPNPKQELPGRVFVTPKSVYLYSCSFGFTVLRHKPISDLVSIEGNASTGWDSLHMLTENGENLSCRVFIDSGRVIKRRLQFLIDNLVAEEPVGLEEIIGRLHKLGIEKKKPLPEVLPRRDEEDGEYSEDDDYREEYGSTKKDLLQQYLDVHQKPVQEVESTIPETKTAAVLNSGLAAMMDRQLLEKEFDVPPKALFHMMFGELSPVFRYEETTLYNRSKLEITPWKLVSSSRLERELIYDFASKNVLSGSIMRGRMNNIQRIERKEDNKHYVVYDRRSPWELPYGAVFYVTMRYVITYASKSSCKLAIWSSIEWIKSSPIARNVVETVVYRHSEAEAKHIVSLLVDTRKRLGHRGMTVTAVRLFGKLGASNAGAINDKTSESSSVTMVDEDANQRPVRFTRQYILGAWADLIRGWAVGIISGVFIMFASLFKKIWKELSVHRFVYICLIISVIYNLILSGRVSVSYWAERSAAKISNQVHIVPNAETIMRRSINLDEMAQLIQTGDQFAEDASGLCYQKFKSIAHYKPLDDSGFDIADFTAVLDLLDLDVNERDFAHRLHVIRNELGARRNDMLVNLRMLNRLEQEAIAAEWRNWLLRELTVCATVSHMALRESNRSSALKAVEAYCSSCSNEWLAVSAINARDLL